MNEFDLNSHQIIIPICTITSINSALVVFSTCTLKRIRRISMVDNLTICISISDSQTRIGAPHIPEVSAPTWHLVAFAQNMNLSTVLFIFFYYSYSTRNQAIKLQLWQTVIHKSIRETLFLTLNESSNMSHSIDELDN